VRIALVEARGGRRLRGQGRGRGICGVGTRSAAHKTRHGKKERGTVKLKPDGPIVAGKAHKDRA